MAQPAQVFITGDPANGYSVVDNSAAPTFPTLNAGAEMGYDTIIGPAPAYGGAINQGANKFSNGTMPDFFVAGSKFTTTASAMMIVSYKLPS